MSEDDWPLPIIDRDAWRKLAACKDSLGVMYDSRITSGGRPPTRPALRAADAAKALCAECSVVAQCAQARDALPIDMRLVGVWAGQAPWEVSSVPKRSMAVDRALEAIRTEQWTTARRIARRVGINPETGTVQSYLRELVRQGLVEKWTINGRTTLWAVAGVVPPLSAWGQSVAVQLIEMMAAGPLRQEDMPSAVKSTRQAVSQALGTLESVGIVERCEIDGRRLEVRLTPYGEVLAGVRPHKTKEIH